MTLTAETIQPDLGAVKHRQKTVWSSGDYPAVGTTLQITGEQLAEAMDLRPDARVLDVAAGNGNATLAAARRFCNVVSTDYVAGWLRNGMERAEAERLEVAFREADAEDLPFSDASFDAVMSTFGVMFTANQDAAAGELLRVCRGGGKIGLANWTPDGFVGEVFRTIGRYNPPPAGVRSPLEWGTESRIAALFGEGASDIRFVRSQFTFRFRSAQHWVDLWKAVYGPMRAAFAALSPEKAEALEADLVALGTARSRSEDTMIVPSEYAEVVILRA
ncbi:MAG: class I SAM-dependent methyltransferase [Pseudooceanicola sp.]|nr:class I SAM-dependent methyltransferase [Pseudooceanicola sp.]